MKHSNVLDKNQDVLCHRDYAERVVASFAHQIQSEYYGGNRAVSIEVIVLEKFSEPTHTESAATAKELTHHAMFYSFCMMAENKMLPQLLHTANTSLHY